MADTASSSSGMKRVLSERSINGGKPINKVENMPLIRRLLRFLAHIDGREKALKLVQYSSRLSLHLIQSETGLQVMTQTLGFSAPNVFMAQFGLTALASTVGQARLVFKLSNWMEGLTRLADVAAGNAPVDVRDPLTYVELLSTIATTANGFCTDAVCLAKTLKSSAWMQYFLPLRLKFFMVAILANASMNLRKQIALQKELRDMPDKRELVTPVSRHKAPLGVPPAVLDGLNPRPTDAQVALGVQLGVLRLAIIKYAVDFAFCVQILWKGPSNVSVAVLGFISALLGASKRWQRS